MMLCRFSESEALQAEMQRFNADKERLLATAHHSIEALQSQVAQKNAQLKQYSEMLAQAHEHFRGQKEAAEREIEKLNDQLIKGGDTTMSKIKAALSFLDDMPNLPKVCAAVMRRNSRSWAEWLPRVVLCVAGYDVSG
jgi:hypothetical protein